MYHCHETKVIEEHPLLAHREDPDTSFAAAKELVESGRLTEQEAEVWNWGIKYQTTAGITNKELASKVASKGYGSYYAIYHEIARRVSGLKNKGQAEWFLVGGKQLVRNKCGVWRFIGD